MSIELAVDMGSSCVTVYRRGDGLVLKEAAVAIMGRSGRKRVPAVTGNAALNYALSAMGNAREIRPVREGAVVNVEDASLMMRDFIGKIVPDAIFKPRIKAIVLISCGLSVTERRDVEAVMENAGIGNVVLAESPLALLAYTNSVGGLFVDAGGGTSEVASVTRTGIASACSVNIAGDLLDDRIKKHFSDRYGIVIGDSAAERLKLDVGSLYGNDLSSAEIAGRDAADGSPRAMEASSADVRAAVTPPLDALIDVVENVLNMTPPELAAEIHRKGIFLSGGTSGLPGLVEYIGVRLGLPVTRLRHPRDAVAYGGGLLLEDGEALNRMLNVKVEG